PGEQALNVARMKFKLLAYFIYGKARIMKTEAYVVLDLDEGGSLQASFVRRSVMIPREDADEQVLDVGRSKSSHILVECLLVGGQGANVRQKQSKHRVSGRNTAQDRLFRPGNEWQQCTPADKHATKLTTRILFQDGGFAGQHERGVARRKHQFLAALRRRYRAGTDDEANVVLTVLRQRRRT